MNPLSLFESCTLCPRACGINRLAGQKGFCGADASLICARAGLHLWEEPSISGDCGSGTVFFSGCNLHCVFCQNRAISRCTGDRLPGKEIDAERLAEIFLALQEKGAANINLVTPTHILPHLLIAIPLAREKGLTIPMVYNCGGYESTEALKLLEGLVDVYLTDYKYVSEEAARRYSSAPDYPAVASRALREMVRQVGAPRFDEKGMLERGVIVRHLVLPDRAADAMALADDLFATYGNRILFSVMNQYTPPSKEVLPTPLDRTLSEEEYERVLSHLEEIGMVCIYAQESGTVSESFIPDFNGEGV